MGKPAILHDTRFSDGTPTASSTADGYNVANLSDWRPYTWWKPVAMPAQVTVDCASAKAADYLFIYGHDLFTKGCTVAVRGSTDNFTSSDVLVASVTPSADTPVMLAFSSAPYRYWRLNITGSAAPSLAVAALGAMLRLPTYLPQGFDPLGRKAVGDTNKNSKGQVLGRVIDFEEWSQEVEITAITWSWVRSTWLPAWASALRSRPFGFAWDPDNYSGEARLVSIKGEFDTPHNAGSLCDLVFELTGVA
jgi:hypothetical protein